MTLRLWEKELYDFILTNRNNPLIRERKIICIKDSFGMTGKLKLQK